MDNVKSLHDTTKNVMETAAGTALAVKQLEMTSKRLMKVFKAVRNFGQMGSEVNNVKKMAKEIDAVIDKYTEGSKVKG